MFKVYELFFVSSCLLLCAGCDRAFELDNCIPSDPMAAPVPWPPPENDIDGDCWDDTSETNCRDDLSRDPKHFPDGPEDPRNGRDDNCNGMVDECTATNDCDSDGVTKQDLDCDDKNPKQSPNLPELCNGIDDNCSGLADEGNPGGGGACFTPIPGPCAHGIEACVAGKIACQQVVFPMPEKCNGIDDNCSGSADEGNPGGGGACSTGLAGQCANGVNVCLSGGITCQQLVSPSNDICDGIDNDCDGVVDDQVPEDGALCNTGLPAACGIGERKCQNGALICTETEFGSTETCNGIDDDCNGVVDDAIEGIPQRIPFFANCSTGQVDYKQIPLSCGSFVGIPVLLHYPNVKEDPHFEINWDVSGSGPGYVEASCKSNDGGVIEGYLAVLPQPIVGTGQIKSEADEVTNQGECNLLPPHKTYPVLDAPYPFVARFPSISAWLMPNPDGTHNADTQWGLPFDNQTPILMGGSSAGGETLRFRFHALGYSAQRISFAQPNLICTTANDFPIYISKPNFGVNPANTRYIPLVSVFDYRDHVAECGQSQCDGDTDDDHGFTITIEGDQDPAQPMIHIHVYNDQANADPLVGIYAAVVAFP